MSQDALKPGKQCIKGNIGSSIEEVRPRPAAIGKDIEDQQPMEKTSGGKNHGQI